MLTWVIGPTSFFYALEMGRNNSSMWVFVLFIGFSICKYLRRNLPTMNKRPFQGNINTYKALVVSYYFILLALTFYLVLSHPELINYGNEQFYILIFALSLPIFPVIIRNEFINLKAAKNINT